jgi:hypothetical protein
MAGLQAQYAPSMYIGLWSRLDGFARDDLTRALEDRSVVQATLMRSTIHLVSREDYWPFAVAVRGARRASWLRAAKAEPPERAAGTLREALAGGRTMRRKEIEALVGKDDARAVGLWVDLVRAPPSGTWERRRADLYALADDWIGPPDVEYGEAVEHLVRRYLAGFGPATAKDVASFTGVAPTDLKPVLDRLDLTREGDLLDLLDLPGAPRPDPETPAPPRFIGTWDASLLVHARRTGFLPEEHRPKIFHTKSPQSFPTFTLDGAVAGTWRHEAGRVELTPFGRVAKADRAALEAEAERLAALHT